MILKIIPVLVCLIITSAHGADIIVSLKNNSFEKAMDELAYENGLTKVVASKDLRLVHYRSKHKVEAKLCPTFNSHPGVEFCELDKKVTPNEELCVQTFDELTQLQNFQKLIAPKVCVLMPIWGPEWSKQRTSLWAQEYTGSDLVRKYLESDPKIKKIENLFSLLDSSEDRHGEFVANLIASPHITGVIPQASAPSYEDVMRSSDYVLAYKKYERKNKRLPHYLNNSMAWESKIIQRVMTGIHERGSVVVVSAGNGSIETKVEAAKAEVSDKIILVGNVYPDGEVLSENDEGVVVLAPSGSVSFAVLSHDNKEYQTFGGTSGAAPQVTGALAAFTLISGHKLTVKEAQNLLRRTALKTPHSYLTPQVHGAGLLNTYKISQVARKIRESCDSLTSRRKKACVQKALSDDSTYQFPRRDLTQVKKTFSSCFSKKPSSASDAHCETRKEHLRLLREEALLHQEDSELWKAIACIHEEDNFTENAGFYRLLANTTTKKRYEETLVERFESRKIDYRLEEDLTLATIEKNPQILIPLVKTGMFYSKFFSDLNPEIFTPELVAALKAIRTEDPDNDKYRASQLDRIMSLNQAKSSSGNPTHP